VSRRKQLIRKNTAISLGVVLAVSAIYLALQRRTEQYSPGETIEGITSELDRKLPDGRPAVKFVNVAREAGIDFVHFSGVRSTQLPEDMGSGAAWGDYDADGDYDLFLVNIAGPLTATAAEIEASPGTNKLYRNDGRGSFTDVTTTAGLEYRGVGMGSAWADYDNDGDLDLVVTTYGELLLYRNRGDGTFEKVAKAAGLRDDRYWSGASWGDYDGDGWIDLYICAYVDYVYRPEDASKSSSQFSAAVPFTLNPSSYPPQPNALFHNNGDGTFTDVAVSAGVDNPTGRSLTASWCDFDLDGWLDLYVANDVSDNAMYRNLGNGRFEDISHAALISDYRGAMGLAVGDYDHDSDPDIFITHWLAQENGFFWNMLFNTPDQAQPGELRFTDIADMLGVGQHALDTIGWGTSFFDYDNDGQLDLFVVNGSTFEDPADRTKLVAMKNFLLWQKSPEDGFFDVAPAAGPAFATKRVGRGAAMADYDEDGDLDIVVVNYGDAPLLLRNDGGNANNWLKVRVRGRSVVGTIVQVEAEGRRQTIQVGSQPSYLSQSAEEAHFGLGNAARIDRVTVKFPGGAVRESTNESVNQVLTVTE
jgi:hypothetical protein